MSFRKIMPFLMMSMMAMGGLGERPEKKRVLSPNERRKCFKEGCNNLRCGRVELYCVEHTKN